MSRPLAALLTIVWLAVGVFAVSLVDRPAWRALGALLFCAGLAIIFVRSSAAREHLASRLPRTTRLLAGLVRLDRRTILATLATAVLAFAVAEALERALAPGGDLVSHIAERYRSLGEVRTPVGGTARTYATAEPPLSAAATLDEAFPAEDQRYTPAGVFLRYEEHIVGVVPDGGRSRLLLESAEDGFRHFAAYVGGFWGPRYDDDAGVPESARAVPDGADVERLVELLRQAEDVHDVCYGWDVRVLSGRREGRSQGSSNRGPGRRVERTDCPDWVQLEGWIDPLAGRFSRRGEPGEWTVGLTYSLDAQTDLPPDALDALSLPEDEVIRGATTEPTERGARPGKGLIELVGAVPLIVEQATGLPSVPLAIDPALSERLSSTEFTDAERRADADWRGLPPALLRTVGLLAALLLVLAVPAALVRWAVRRTRR